VFLINQGYKQQRIEANKWMSVQRELIKACNGLVWLRFNVADSYVHHENEAGKRQVFSGLYEQLSAKEEEFSMIFFLNFKMFQRDDTLYSTLLFPVSRSTCFGRKPRPTLIHDEG
jgi:hypothetical protein